MKPQLAAVLAYLLMPLSSVVMFFVEPKNKFVKFHAIQGVVVGVILIVLNRIIVWIASSVLYSPTVGAVVGLLFLVLGIGSLALWVLLMVKAYEGKAWRVPVIGDIAAQQADK